MWDERYLTDDFLFGTEPAAFLRVHAELLKPGHRALVIADGEGRNSAFMAQRGVAVTAMDASSVGIAKARRLAAERQVTIDFQEADLLAWQWQPEAYDLVVGIFIQFLSPADRPAVFKGMQQTLRTGGRVLLHGYTPKQVEYGTGGPPDADYMYTEDLLSGAFGGLTIERLEAYEAVIEEGTGHVGQSALIDLIAQKK